MRNRITTAFFSEHSLDLQPGQVAAIRRPGSEDVEWLAANIEGQSLVLVPALCAEITENPRLYSAIEQAVRSSERSQSQQPQQSQQYSQRGEQRSRSASAGGLNL